MSIVVESNSIYHGIEVASKYQPVKGIVSEPSVVFLVVVAVKHPDGLGTGRTSFMLMCLAYVVLITANQQFDIFHYGTLGNL